MNKNNYKEYGYKKMSLLDLVNRATLSIKDR